MSIFRTIAMFIYLFGYMIVHYGVLRRAELEVYKNRNTGGRKKHDEAWMTSYRDFAVKYESGMTIMEIVAEGEISRRTAYRYKAYYDELQKNKGNMHE